LPIGRLEAAAAAQPYYSRPLVLRLFLSKHADFTGGLVKVFGTWEEEEEEEGLCHNKAILLRAKW